MKKVFLIVIFSILYPAYASCPIDLEGGACIADLEKVKTINPKLQHPEETIFPENFMSKEIENNFSVDNTAKGKKRDFGPQNNDYGYNPSCQFGICTNSSTPKTFDSSQQ